MSDDSKIGVRKSIFQNSLAIFSGRILTTIFSFLIIPVVIRKVGMDAYGAWESILAVSALSSVLQVVVSGTVLWLVSTAHGLQEGDRIQGYFRVGLFFILLLCAIASPSIWFIRESIIEHFKVPLGLRESVVWLLPSVVILSSLMGVNELLASLIGGVQRSGSAALTQAASTLAGSIATIVGLQLGLGFESMFVGFAISAVTANVGLYRVAKRLVPTLTLKPMLPSRDLLQLVAPYAGFMLLGAISGALRDQTDKIVLASAVSSVWAGYYGIASRLAGIVMIVCTFFYVPIIAASGAVYSKSNQRGVGEIYRDMSAVVAWVVGLVIVLLGGMYDRLLMIWIGNPIPEVEPIFLLLLLGNGMAVMFTAVGTSVCKGMGIVRIETRYIIVGLAINIALKAVLVPWVGGMGAVISTAVSWSLSSILFMYLLHKHTEIPWEGSIRLIKSALLILICLVVNYLWGHLLPVGQSRLDAALYAMLHGVLIASFFSSLLVIFGVIPVSLVLSQLSRFKQRLFRRRCRQG